MIPNFTVVYDACVLYPNTLRDLLMELAVRDLYRAKWTDEIHDEWIRNLKQNKPDLPLEKLYRVRDLINKGIPIESDRLLDPQHIFHEKVGIFTIVKAIV